MPNIRKTTVQRILKLLTCVLIVKVTVSVILIYRDYLPPNFESDFLRGRQSYFSGSYQWAFYTHIVSGPCSLFLGMILLNERFRREYLPWHRRLGRIQVACVLLLTTLSGLWMARYAETGAVAGLGFASLAIATAVCVACGWRAAVTRQLGAHRRWMIRCYVLLCSAVVLRLIAGLATVTGSEAVWLYPLSAWVSWLLPLAVFELSQGRHRFRHFQRP